MKVLNTQKQSQPRHSGPDNRRTLWDRIWKDKQGRIVIYQPPNALIISWAILAAISLFVPSGVAENTFWWLSSLVLIIWAALEIYKGVNYFRQTLGVVVLGLTIASIFSIGL